ncbi:MAG: hypothetical protein PHZ00_04870 [Candidatus Peribacteraceae bacterium]|nr:hypothetical protein [Candidatus Peribacteraceae bacterium]
MTLALTFPALHGKKTAAVLLAAIMLGSGVGFFLRHRRRRHPYPILEAAVRPDFVT